MTGLLCFVDEDCYCPYRFDGILFHCQFRTWHSLRRHACNISYLYTAYIVAETLAPYRIRTVFFLAKRVAGGKLSLALIPLPLCLEREIKICSFVWKKGELDNDWSTLYDRK